jgi:trk system potassium uptake protein TrkA
VGQTVSVIEARTRTRVAFFSRMGKGLLPTQDTIYQDGDLVHLMLPVDGVARVERILAKPPVHDD